jgi:bifunctional non-homologous end joining protein LigD
MRTEAPRPMLATIGGPPKRYAQFGIEAKYDGQRGIAIVDRKMVTLLSRNVADITHTFCV